MRTPSTLRLPCSVARSFRLEALITAQLGVPWSEGWRLREMFALSGPELAFARELVDRRRNLWLYRTNQRHFCADFIVVDMSAPRDRRACALELKAGEPLREGAAISVPMAAGAALPRGVGGIQFAGLPAALAELAPVIGAGEVTTAQGSPEAMLAYLGRRAA